MIVADASEYLALLQEVIDAFLAPRLVHEIDRLLPG
jgi:hypothetical protein